MGPIEYDRLEVMRPKITIVVIKERKTIIKWVTMSTVSILSLSSFGRGHNIYTYMLMVGWLKPLDHNLHQSYILFTIDKQPHKMKDQSRPILFFEFDYHWPPINRVLHTNPMAQIARKDLQLDTSKQIYIIVLNSKPINLAMSWPSSWIMDHAMNHDKHMTIHHYDTKHGG